MSDLLVTVGAWVHVMLNAIVCFSPTRNPIWGELRAMLVATVTMALWACLTLVLS